MFTEAVAAGQRNCSVLDIKQSQGKKEFAPIMCRTQMTAARRINVLDSKRKGSSKE